MDNGVQWQVEEIRDNIDRIQGCVEEVKRNIIIKWLKSILLIDIDIYHNVQ